MYNPTLNERRFPVTNQAAANDRVSDTQDSTAEQAPPKIRVSIDISPELYAKLQGLSRDIRGTKSDVIRKSLALMDVAVQARKNGKKIGIADKSEQLSTEIIGFEY
jgi:predicted transcriptional regulator